jgi:predicted ATPase/class 3 adenylate cyclase
VQALVTIIAMSTLARALLLTDVVDSTRLVETLGDDAAAEMWARHDRVARDLLLPFGGREIDKTDGMLLLFDGAREAVAYADAYHRALAALPERLKARAGLHVGPVLLRENPPEDVARGAKPIEVEGLAKPTTARVMVLARAGQTLLTRPALDALQDGGGSSTLPVHAHGHWQMKGLAEPIELFAVGSTEAAALTPSDGDKGWRVVREDDHWRPVREIANNLPQQTTAFIGRTREIAEVRAQLGKSRLLTLLGMGGLGKTRLSLRVASELLGEYPDGVWFLDFAPIRDAALVAAEAAQVLGLRDEPDRPLVRTLAEALKQRRTLLIFDNCEHLVAATADLAAALLRAAPGLHILASSREPLRVPGEQIYPVQPLPVPDAGGGLAALAESTAVRLFVNRAQGHRPGFVLSEADAPVLAELVARLEGIPLALELAAARLRALNLGEVNARLKDRYKLLTGGGRVLLPRQQTLRALVDWSYELLNGAEQVLLARLAVFAGGFDLEAAEAVCGSAPIEPGDVMDLVASLADKSLVTVSDVGGGTRYRMLETIRDYAQGKLALREGLGGEPGGDRGGEQHAVAARHLAHYFALAKAVRDGLGTEQQALWVERAELELDNLRLAMAFALKDGAAGGTDAFVVVKFALAMTVFWRLRGYAAEGRALLAEVLKQPAIQASDLAHAHALFVDAALASARDEHAEALVMLQACLALRRRLGDPVAIAAALSTLALTRLQSGDPDGAERDETEALALFRAQGQALGEAISLLHLGEVGVFRGDAGAGPGLQACLALARSIGNREVESEAGVLLGLLALDVAADIGAARRALTSALARESAAHDRRNAALATWGLARCDLAEQRAADAAAGLTAALAVFHDFQMRKAWAECLEDHAELALLRDDPMGAVEIAAAAQTFRARFELARTPRLEHRWLQREAALHAALPAMVFAQCWDAGALRAPEAAMRHARAQVVGVAEVAEVGPAPAEPAVA